MGRIGELFIVLDAKIDRFNKGMSDAESAMVRVGKKFEAVGKKMTMMVTLPILALGVAAVKVGADFEQSITNAFAVTGASSDKVKEKMEALARTMGEKTIFSAKEAADAMYFMASAGWKIEQMTNALEPTLALAAATQSDLAFATEAVIVTLNQFGLQSSDAAMVSNVFAAAISGSQATLDKLRESLKYIGPMADIMGWSIEDTTAILSSFYEEGIGASTAGTALRMAFSKLAAGTPKVKKALKELGLTMADVNPETQSLGTIIELLSDKTMSLEQAINIFGVRAGPNMLKVLKKGSASFTEFRDKITGTQAAAEMMQKQLDTLSGQWKILTSKLTESAIQISKVLIPAIRELIENQLMPAVDSFNKLTEGTKKTIVKIAGLVAAFGPLLLIMGKALQTAALLRIANIKLGASFAYIVGPIGLAYGAYKGLMAIRDKYYKQVTGRHIQAADKEQKAWNKLTERVGRFTDSLHKLSGKMKEQGVHWEKSGKIIKKIDKSWQEHGQTIKTYKEILAGKWGEEAKRALLAIGGAELEAAIQAGKLEKATDDMSDIVEEAEKAIREATGATEGLDSKTKTLTGTVKDLIPKIKDERTEIEKLNDEYWDLMGTVFNGEAAWQKALEQFVELKGKIKALADEFSDLDMAIEDDAEEWIDFGDKVEGVLEGMGHGMGSIPDKAEDATKETTSLWGEMADGLKTKWASTISDVITGTTSLKDGLKGIWDAIKTQFADMAGEMVAKWLTSLAEMKTSAGASVIPIIGVFVGMATTIIAAFEDAGERIAGAMQNISVDALRGLSQAEKDLNEDNAEAAQSTGDWGRALGTLSRIMEKVTEDAKLSMKEQKMLNDAWADAISLTKEYGMEGSKAFTDMIEKMRELGIESKALTQYLFDQLGVMAKTGMSAAEGLEAMAAHVGNNEAAMARLENQTLAVYNAMITAGATASQAFDALGATLDAIAAKHKENGTQASAAIQALLGVREVTKANQDLMTAIEGNLAVLTALANTGSLTQEILDDSATSAKKYYNELINAGMSGNEALAQMAPTLQHLAWLAEQHGYELDNNTQKLYDEAVAAGYVAEQQMSLNDIMLEGLAAIIQALGGDLPDAFRDAIGGMEDFADDSEDAFGRVGDGIDDIQDDLDGLHAPDLTIDISGNFGKLNKEMDKWIGGRKGRAIPAFQHGGLVEETGLAYVHKGEWVLPKIAVPSLPSTALPRPANIQSVLGASGSQGETIMHNTVIINAQKLDDYTIQQAGEKLFYEIDRQQNKRRGQ